MYIQISKKIKSTDPKLNPTFGFSCCIANDTPVLEVVRFFLHILKQG